MHSRERAWHPITTMAPHHHAHGPGGGAISLMHSREGAWHPITMLMGRVGEP